MQGFCLEGGCGKLVGTGVISVSSSFLFDILVSVHSLRIPHSRSCAGPLRSCPLVVPRCVFCEETHQSFATLVKAFIADLNGSRVNTK